MADKHLFEFNQNINVYQEGKQDPSKTEETVASELNSRFDDELDKFKIQHVIVENPYSHKPYCSIEVKNTGINLGKEEKEKVQEIIFEFVREYFGEFEDHMLEGIPDRSD